MLPTKAEEQEKALTALLGRRATPDARMRSCDRSGCGRGRGDRGAARDAALFFSGGAFEQGAARLGSHGPALCRRWWALPRDVGHGSEGQRASGAAERPRCALGRPDRRRQLCGIRPGRTATGWCIRWTVFTRCTDDTYCRPAHPRRCLNCATAATGSSFLRAVEQRRIDASGPLAAAGCVCRSRWTDRAVRAPSGTRVARDRRVARRHPPSGGTQPSELQFSRGASSASLGRESCTACYSAARTDVCSHISFELSSSDVSTLVAVYDLTNKYFGLCA